MDNKNLNEDDLYANRPSADEELYSEKLLLDKTPPPKKRGKGFTDSETQIKLDREKSAAHKPEVKKKLSHAESSGIAISAVMLIYSISEQDKPLFFLSISLLIFLLRPLIGALFGEHSQAVQNALHSFSVVLFIGALILLFL